MFFFFKQKTAYEMSLRDWSSDVCSSDLFAYVTVDGIDALYREFAAKSVPRVQDLSDKPWGMREFGVRTPDGHRIMFGQRVPT